MYAGLLMAGLGLAIVSRNECRLALTALLWFVLDKKVGQLPAALAFVGVMFCDQGRGWACGRWHSGGDFCSGQQPGRSIPPPTHPGAAPAGGV